MSGALTTCLEIVFKMFIKHDVWWQNVDDDRWQWWSDGSLRYESSRQCISLSRQLFRIYQLCTSWHWKRENDILLHIVKPLKPSRAKQNCSRRHFYFVYFYSTKKIRLDISCESSAQQRIHMKYQVLFSLKNNEQIQDCRLLQSWLAP